MELVEELLNGNLQHGMHEVGSDLDQRHQHECSSMQERVRNGKPVRFDDMAAVEEQVEIECARRIPEGADSAEIVLDPLQSIEQGFWFQIGVEHECRVQESRLIEVPDRLGLIK